MVHLGHPLQLEADRAGGARAPEQANLASDALARTAPEQQADDGYGERAGGKSR